MRRLWALLFAAILFASSMATGHAVDHPIVDPGAPHAGSFDVPRDEACNDEHANPGHACCASALVHCMTAVVGDAGSSANVSALVAAFALPDDERFRTAGAEAEIPPPRP